MLSSGQCPQVNSIVVPSMSSDWCSSRLISTAIVAHNQNGQWARSELISGENLTTTSKLNRWIFKFIVDGLLLLNWTAEYFNSISMVSLTNNSWRLLLEQPECRSIAKVSWDEVPTKYHIETTSKRISQTRIIGGRTLLSFQAYLSYGSSLLGVRQEKDLSVTKDSMEVKDLLLIPSFKSKLIKKFTFIDATVINISMRSFDQVHGKLKRWNNKNHVFMLKTRAPSHCQTSARSTASPCTWRGGQTRLFPWIYQFLHKWGMGRLDDDSRKHYHFCKWRVVGRLYCHLAAYILIVKPHSWPRLN